MALAHDETRAGRLDGADASATVDNPLCGDRVTLDVRLDGGKITEIAHHVRGCALCAASAAALSAAAEGRDADSLRSAREQIAALLAGGAPPGAPWEAFGAFAPVAAYKSRHSCVTLPFDALDKAFAGT